MRYFRGQEVELLAPAGNFDIFCDILDSGADAFYLGGKHYNMRLHRKEFNFEDQEIEEAVSMAHAKGKKVYVTVNNLFSEEDLVGLEDYLRFLSKIKVDAIIVQDYSVIEIVNTLGIDIEIHSSVMMNVHNLESVKALKAKGVTRIVTSREISLDKIREFAVQCDMEFEYFMHGDMCISHGSQCVYSGMLFGKSGNRGMCMKPCRWGFKIKSQTKEYETSYPLAAKDMSMYSHVPELIQAGVVSFKIEGRMRDSEYLKNLIGLYNDAIKRYLEDPVSYDRKLNYNILFENRKRDLTTAYAFGNPGLDFINERYEGTGKFYSTGKPFSNPTPEISISPEIIEDTKKYILEKSKSGAKVQAQSEPWLGVRVNNFAQAVVAIKEGAEHIYLSGDVFLPEMAFSKKEIQKLSEIKGSSKIFLCLPRMMFEPEFAKYSVLLENRDLKIDGIVATNIGNLEYFKKFGYSMVGDFSMNIYNHIAATHYKKSGLEFATLSLESPLANTIEVLNKSVLDLEIIVHGKPGVMYLESDLFLNLDAEDESYAIELIDEKGHTRTVRKDVYARNHVLSQKEICLLAFIQELTELGAKGFKIEGSAYDEKELGNIIRLYKNVISKKIDSQTAMKELKSLDNYTLGGLYFK